MVWDINKSGDNYGIDMCYYVKDKIYCLIGFDVMIGVIAGTDKREVTIKDT